MNKVQIVTQIDQFFDQIMLDPEKMNIDELIYIIEAIIPVHAKLEIDSFDDVDVLLAVYPYIFQKLVRLYSLFIHKVRVAVQLKDTQKANIFRAYRDPIEQLLKAVKMQYESLSRRVTVNIERRG